MQFKGDIGYSKIQHFITIYSKPVVKQCMLWSGTFINVTARLRRARDYRAHMRGKHGAPLPDVGRFRGFTQASFTPHRFCFSPKTHLQDLEAPASYTQALKWASWSCFKYHFHKVCIWNRAPGIPWSILSDATAKSIRPLAGPASHSRPLARPAKLFSATSKASSVAFDQ